MSNIENIFSNSFVSIWRIAYGTMTTRIKTSVILNCKQILYNNRKRNKEVAPHLV